MNTQCAVCSNTKRRHNMCCADEISRLRRHSRSQSEVIDRLEGQIMAMNRPNRRLPTVTYSDPWMDYDEVDEVTNQP